MNAKPDSNSHLQKRGPAKGVGNQTQRPASKRTAAALAFIALIAVYLVGVALCPSVQASVAPPDPTTPAATQPAAAASAEPNDPNRPAPAPAPPVSAGAAAPTATLTLEELQARKKQAAETADLADDVKARLAETYDKAIAQLKLADELAARRQQYAQAAKAAPTALADIQNTLAQPPAAAAPTLPPELTLAQAEQNLTQTTAELEEARKKAAELENAPKLRAERRTKIPQESNAAKQQLDEIQGKLATAATPGQPSPLTEANRILLQLQQRALEARLAVNADELMFYDATNDLLAGQRDMAARRAASLEKLVAFWQETVSAMRQQAAQAAKDEAARKQRQAQDAHPLIQNAVQKNAELAEAQTKRVAEIEKTTQYASRVDEQLATLDKDFAEMRDQVGKAGGVTNVLGLRLLAKRNALPRTTENRRRLRNRPAKIAEVQFKWIEYDSAWSRLSDIDQQIDSLLEQADANVPPDQRDAIGGRLREALQTQRKTLKALSDLSLDYATRLANLDTRERVLVRTVDAFANFIDANILWVKSSGSLALSDLPRIIEGLTWLVSPANWVSAGSALWTDLKAHPVIHLLIVLVVLSVFVLHAKLHNRIEVISESVRQIQTDSFRQTIQVFVLTLVLAATWPITLLMVAWRLSTVAVDDFTRATAAGLFLLALAVFALSFLYHLATPHGLARDHFRMRQETLVFLRRHLRWLTALVVPVVFVFEAMNVQAMNVQQVNDPQYGTVGRLFFVGGLVGLAAFLAIVLRPTAPLMDAYFRQRRGGWLDRLRYLWYPLCVLLPLVLAVLAGMGYVYGARYLNDKLLLTMGLILVVLLLRALFVRGLVVAQRRLALLEREKRQDAEQKAQDTQTPPAETADTKAKPESTIFEISQQTRRLIGAVTTILLVVGFWYLWSDVLPAFAKLGEHPLYTIGQDPTTLGAVVTALVVTILTVIVARNVPGLLEIFVLRRLPIDRGVRFAIITICRYILVIVGVVWAFSEIGIGWSKVQWLIAAMTVGLGFGLQEIFANFVSGLIILFEQPIRVDDIVTVGDVTGRVSMIKIRATTIRRWDQRELIVPNKEFITGQLINWTLTDNILRRDFAVGIAYGSDIRKAERILYEIAQADPRVMKDPAPTVLFKGFGNSSLDFELRVNYSGIEINLPLWHDINVAIDDRFREAGIEIAFPQHDLHLRSVDLDIPLHLRRDPPMPQSPPPEPTP